MLNLSYKDFPDLAVYKRNLSLSKELMKSEYGNNEIYISVPKVKDKLNYDIIMCQTVEKILIDYIKLNSGYRCFSLNKADILQFLLRHENVPAHLLTDRKTKNLSLDQTKILSPLYDKGYAKKFLEMYFLLKDYETKVSRSKSLISESIPTDLTDSSGTPLNALPYTISVADTGRVYTKDYNIQAIHKDYVDVISAPKDYILFWCDFSQIDLRVMYNIFLREPNSKADQVFSQCEDKYEAIARIMHMTLGDEFDKAEFTKNRKDYKTGVLARAYNAHKHTLSRSIRNEQFVDTLDRFFKRNRKYQDYFRKVNDVVNFGIDMQLTDYFGYQRTVPIVPDRKNDAIAQGMNTPIQTTSNSIVVNMVNAIIDRFRQNGFGEDKARVYMCRHDEVVLLLHKDTFKHLWWIGDLTTVQVDDWDILTTDPHAGYCYNEPNDKLTESIINQWSKREMEMTPRVLAARKEKYTPISLVGLMGLGVYQLPTGQYTIGLCRTVDVDRKPILYMVRDLAAPTAREAYVEFMLKSYQYFKDNNIIYLEICDILGLAKSVLYEGIYVKVNTARRIHQDEATKFLSSYIQNGLADTFDVCFIGDEHPNDEAPMASEASKALTIESTVTDFFSDFEEV